VPDKPVRAMDPLGIIALANVLVRHQLPECSCENKPVPCSCQNECSCEMKCLTVCSCELKPVQIDLLDMVTNPIFREAVKGLDISRLKSIEDFLRIVEEIRTKIDSSRPPTR
jgi:hypothetical protein